MIFTEIKKGLLCINNEMEDNKKKKWLVGTKREKNQMMKVRGLRIKEKPKNGAMLVQIIKK